MDFLLVNTLIVISRSVFVATHAVEHSHVHTVPELVTAEGYYVENHYVPTYDGYILNVHRIPCGRTGRKNNKVAYLQHGILQSSSVWVLFGPRKSLAYILADEGYDVWMGNSRGNVYSRNHTTLDPDTDSAFWQFSWDELGSIDLPATINYVLERTGTDGIYYVGHSQGTTAYYVMVSTRPEYNEKIRVQVSLAPVAFMKHMTSPLLRFAAFWDRPLNILMQMFGVNEFLPGEGFLSSLTEEICSEGIGPILCQNTLFAICGFSPREVNASVVPVIMSYTPAGSSTKQFFHYAQLVKSGQFCRYDYGLLGNRKNYGTFSPPKYKLGDITAPTYLIYSENDWLTAKKDVDKLAASLGNCRGKLLLSENSFNHLDFLFGKDAPRLVYNKVISLLSRH